MGAASHMNVSDDLKIRVFPGRCLNARNNLFNCNYCVWACSAEAISYGIDGLRVDEQRCVHCGICLAACPMEVFEPGGWSEGSFIENLKALHASEPENPCVLVCPIVRRIFGTPPGAHHTRVCFAAYSPGALLEATWGGGLELHTGHCSECPCVHGLEVLSHNATLVNEIHAAAGSPYRVWLVTHEGDSLSHGALKRFFSDPIDRFCVGERGLTAGFLRKGSRLFGASDHRTSSPGNQQNAGRQSESAGRGQGCTASRKNALDLRITRQHTSAWRLRLAHFWTEEPGLVGTKTVWPALDLDAEKCVACGGCRQYCPTGAIRHQVIDGLFNFMFRPGRCADCGLCALSCPTHALTRYYDICIEPFSSATLISTPATECVRCGSPYPARRGNLCFWCENEPSIERLLQSARQALVDG
jgi:ferredoxin